MVGAACRMPSWLAPVWLDQSVRHRASRWVAEAPSRPSQRATVGMAPLSAAASRTSWTTPSSCRKRCRGRTDRAGRICGGGRRAGRAGAGRRRRRARRGAPPVAEATADMTAATTTAVSGRYAAAPRRVYVDREEQQPAVEEEDQQPQDERRYQEQQPDHQRPHQGGQQAEGAGADRGGDGDVGRAVAVGRLEPEVRQDPGEHEHGEGGHGPHRDTPPHLTGDPAPTPSTHAPHTSRPGPSSARACPHPVTTVRSTRLSPGSGSHPVAGFSGRRTPPSASTVCGGRTPSSRRRRTVRRGRPSRSGRRAAPHSRGELLHRRQRALEHPAAGRHEQVVSGGGPPSHRASWSGSQAAYQQLSGDDVAHPFSAAQRAHLGVLAAGSRPGKGSSSNCSSGVETRDRRHPHQPHGVPLTSRFRRRPYSWT